MAQVSWAAGNLPSAVRFARALRDPAGTQSAWLRHRLRADADSVFGREHDFRSMRDSRDFSRRVPIREWTDFSSWIERIRGGERNVLGTEAVGHLAPTGGSTGARKLIPFTPSLHRAFARAVGAWMTDLTRLAPGVLGGPAYWSISPMAAAPSGPVPVGFADDAEYLGGWKARLARHLMAVPSGIRHERDPDQFWRRTAQALLACRDLRLISVWHPSFLGLILDAAASRWPDMLDAVPRRRAAELRSIGPDRPDAWWPALKVISCWGDLAAAPGMAEIAGRFPGCRVQAKGLLATEAVVTIPWRDCYPLAVTSHFFEFLSDAGDVLAPHELERGQCYEVIVTNGGGLWRYRLGDLVECDGFLAATPTLRFLGRAGNVSDLRGEKLSEPFVAQCLADIRLGGGSLPPAFLSPAFLRPCVEEGQAPGYALVVSSPVDESIAKRLDDLLRRNPHYDLARNLGQLGPVRLHIDPASASLQPGDDNRRIGDLKPMILDIRSGGR